MRRLVCDSVTVAGGAPRFSATSRSEDDEAAASVMAESGYLRHGLRLTKWLVSSPCPATFSCNTRRWPPLVVRPSRRTSSVQLRDSATAGSSCSLLYESARSALRPGVALTADSGVFRTP